MRAQLLFAGAALLMSAGTAGAWTEQVIYSFCPKGGTCPDGIGPDGPLVMDAQGDIFGATFDGGLDGQGVAFRLRPKRGKFDHTTLFKFDGQHGGSPIAGLIIDTGGNLYGTTTLGGASAKGVVVELVRKSGNHFAPVVLYDFCAQQSCADGGFPTSELAYAGKAAGMPYDGSSPLYGTTEDGGATGSGVVFQLTSDGKQTERKETVIYNFCSQQGCSDGGPTESGLAVDPDGNLFGVTNAGGNAQDAGVIFELASGGNGGFAQSVLYDFCSKKHCTDGWAPRADLVLDSAGNLFGTTSQGGAYDSEICHGLEETGCGTVFELSGAHYTVLHSFCADQTGCSDGFLPFTSVTLGKNGDLFGTTQLGGTGGEGTIFQLHGNKFTTLYSFCIETNCSDGEGPGTPVLIDSSGNLFGATYGGGNFDFGALYELKR